MKPEDAFHCQVADYLDLVLPAGYFWTTFPAGGGGLLRGKLLKAKGLKPGLPDLVVFKNLNGWVQGQVRAALWIELKARSGLSQKQRDCHEALRALGHEVVVAKSLSHVHVALEDFCFPDSLRGRFT